MELIKLMKMEIFKDQYICELTEELDNLSGIDKLSECQEYQYRHYILIDNETNILFIRVPGGTVGYIVVDKNNVIKNITIDTKYIIKTYPENIGEILDKYIGKVIEFQS